MTLNVLLFHRIVGSLQILHSCFAGACLSAGGALTPFRILCSTPEILEHQPWRCPSWVAGLPPHPWTLRDGRRVRVGEHVLSGTPDPERLQKATKATKVQRRNSPVSSFPSFPSVNNRMSWDHDAFVGVSLSDGC